MTSIVPRPEAAPARVPTPGLDAQRRARAAAIVGGLSWAAQLKADTAFAVAYWCQSRDIDPNTEMDVLGGKPLVNARWWLRKIGELGDALEYVREDLIHADPRLEELMKLGDEWAKTESLRRIRARIMTGAPEEASAICVVHIKLRSMADEVTGMQFAGGGTGRKIAGGGALKRGAEADPIGETFPVESATTRAYGKAGRILAGFFPKLGAAIKAADDDEGLAHRVAEDKRATEASTPSRGVPLVKHTDDPYATMAVTAAEDLALDAQIAAQEGQRDA